MNKKLFWLISILVILGVAPNLAAEKIRDICPMLKFQGDVIKNKETKQKEPSGQGLLYVPEHYQKTPQNAILSIEGTFRGDTIENTVLSLQNNIKHKGKAQYSYAFNKKTKEIEVKITFTDGFVSVEGSSREQTVNAPQSSEMRYTFIIDEGRHVKLAQPSRTIVYYSSPLQIDAVSVISDMIVDNKWAARWNDNGGGYCNWEPIWVQGTLKNGMTVSETNRYGTGLSFKGDKNTYLSYEKNDNSETYPKLRLPLKDGGFFEWNKQAHIIRLIYPSGEIYEGTFSKVPFDFDKYNWKSKCFDYDARVKGYYCDGTLFKQIANSSVSDYMPSDGSYIYPDGNRRYMTNGVEIAPKIETGNNAKKLPHFDDIVATHLFVTDRSDLPYFTNGKIKKEPDGNNLLYKLSRGLLYYAGKDNGDQLDKELYLKSEQYRADKQVYDSLRTNQLFYSTQRVHPTFTLKGIIIQSLGYDNKFNVVQIGDGAWFPLKVPIKRYESSGFYYGKIEIPIKSREDLKLLKDCQDNLQLVATYRAGEWNSYWNEVIASPVALYISDKKSGAILYDLSSILKAPTTADIQRRTERARRQDAAEERQRQAELDSKYHKQAIRKACSWCLGRGYVQGYMSQEQKCPVCHGKGYEYTHYY